MAIPKEMQTKYNEIAPLIIEFCDEKLNDDYKDLCLHLLEKLCRKRPSPLLSGSIYTWAAGIVYAIGSNNFIFDKTQKLHLTADEIADPFDIAASTAGNKASQIKKMFKMDYFNTEWQLPELAENNPTVWMIRVNGLIVDARDMSLEIQQQAYEMGVIPYIPDEEDDDDEEEEEYPKDEKLAQEVNQNLSAKPERANDPPRNIPGGLEFWDE